MRVVIIGGVAGGMSAATRLRRLSEETEIIVIEKGPYVSFANCGLPYHLSREIEEREDLIVQSPKQLRKRFNIDVRPEQEVTKIDRENKRITVRKRKNEYELTYDVLVMSPGAKPVMPSIQGLQDANNIFTLRNIPDMDAIETYSKQNGVEEVVVIGGGFIGLEAAENLNKAGMTVTLVEAQDQVLPTVDKEMAIFVKKELEKNGVNVVLNSVVTSFEKYGKSIRLKEGKEISTDMTIMSVGVTPESTLAKDAGLEIGYRGGIVVDEKYQTSDASIYAVGDAIVVKHQITKSPTLISLASPANRQGRQVADVIMGKERNNLSSLGTAIVRVFDLACGSTGMTEKQLQEHNLSYKAVHIVANNHAGYFPGARPMTLKLLFDQDTGQIYGAQAFGTDGVDKRIDILATAIKANLTVEDLPELEFSYAPPFGSAKDPVNMIGYAALNIIEGISDNIQYYELEEEIKKDALVVDVRTKAECQRMGKIKDAINIPVDDMRERLSEIPKNRTIIVSCQSGLRSYIAERMLKNNGYQVKNLDGAFHIYSAMYPEKIVEKKPSQKQLQHS